MAESREVVIEYDMLDFGEYMLGLGEYMLGMCEYMHAFSEYMLKISPNYTATYLGLVTVSTFHLLTSSTGKSYQTGGSTASAPEEHLLDLASLT
jgi:hypothetical protein